MGSSSMKWRLRLVLAGINRCTCALLGPARAKCLLARVIKGRRLNLAQPEQLNEKLLAWYYRADWDLLARLTDKYEVRDYLVQKGLGDILVPIFGLYSNFSQIQPETLPRQFVLKATHGCEMNVICPDKSHLDWPALQKQVRFWMTHSIGYIGLELHYNRIPPRLICEQYLGSPTDYKLHCSRGQVLFALVCTDRTSRLKLDVFMPDWTHRTDVVVHAESSTVPIARPKSWNRMLEIAQCLSQDFPFVRVDLYEVEGKVYFGEMTFTPASGVLHNFSESFLREQGARMSLFPTDESP